MPTRTPRRAAAAVVAVLLTACGADDAGGTSISSPSDAPPASSSTGATPPAPSADAGQDAAGGTTMRVYSVPEALAADVEGPVHVSGLLIDDGSGWRLCAGILESMPPQCGGEALVVEALDEAGRTLEETGGVRWQDQATVVGEVADGTITETGSPASS